MNTYRGVPVALAILAALPSYFWFFASKLQIGRRIYAVGGNLEAARRAGINTTAVRWIVFGISGMMAGVAGVMLVGYSAAGSTTTAGPDLLLDVISIAVIGGVSLTGGKGTVWAVLLGGLVIASLDSGLNLMATDPYYVYVIKGAILLAAIALMWSANARAVSVGCVAGPPERRRREKEEEALTLILFRHSGNKFGVQTTNVRRRTRCIYVNDSSQS